MIARRLVDRYSTRPNDRCHLSIRASATPRAGHRRGRSDAAGVDQPLAGRISIAVPSSGLAPVRLAAVAPEPARHVRVADQADTLLLLDVEALAAWVDRETTPTRSRGARVVEADAGGLARGSEARRNSRCRRGTDVAAGPGAAGRGSSRSSDVDVARGPPGRGRPARQPSTTSETISVQSSGSAPYPTMSPAAPHLVGVVAADVGEHGLQAGKVAVDVRDDR